ncbi:uncharacterized protein LOC104584790 [Brachypodium distachyon]|uniref:uncharacterized protein LOC104584790 n=1 Tax=Brachypodium distachyon TaxID=15368 RepID=UPI000D0E1BD4|nr:uncharacterized protein LOC104584790 [Brachypodium distachyon]XP_024318566.1 uncharacterized protein LOC104584790 [Brachypodium distachyon]XP_024318567.1 uncharacterized protein LOC104584790 [Brachypodium distachyon]|eukprot:XP_024318565.1 uncharacterized protein LOC104584790 [Brachypodium distachyon]
MGRPRRDHGQCPAEYLLHLRRLDAFLKHHGLLQTAYTLEMESRVLFEPTRLQMLVTQGKWSEADRYLRCFSALWKDDGDGAAQYTALQGSLNFNAVLAWLACRGEEGGRAAARFKPPSDAFRKADPEAAKLKDIYCSMTSQQARESVNWEEIKLGTIDKMEELLRLGPDLERVPSNRLP